MKNTEVIFIPSPGIGHLVSVVEFSKRLIARDSRLSITILAMNSPFPPTTPLNQTQINPTPSPGEPRFIFLPQAQLPPIEILDDSVEDYITKFAASHVNHVRNAILTLQESSPNRFHLFVDMFCTSFIDVANDLHIPSYIFFASGAAFLGLLLHLPERSVFRESDPETKIPGFRNPVPVSGLPGFAFSEAGYTAFANQSKRFKETKGIVVNTFAELEVFAIKALEEVKIPIYTVGPVLDLKRGQELTPQEMRIMQWLDTQPESSVVFLCFGSVGAFSEEQAKEIAKGISRSGARFLWSMRKKTTTGAKRPVEYNEEELKRVLGSGFWRGVEEGRGMVCGWAPQVEVLGHGAIGCFVSHCGWNSSLESVWFGKPIVAWPLYAEQRNNAFELVNELGLAAKWLGCGDKGGDVVKSDEVERAIRCVMDKGNPVRSRVKEMSELSKASLLNGGSSFESIGCLIRNIMGDEEI